MYKLDTRLELCSQSQNERFSPPLKNSLQDTQTLSHTPQACKHIEVFNPLHTVYGTCIEVHKHRAKTTSEFYNSYNIKTIRMRFVYKIDEKYLI